MKTLTKTLLAPTIKRAPLCFIVAILLLTISTTKAQGDANQGIYVDGTFVDKIDCWTFKKLSFVFPISEKYKKYDVIVLWITIDYINDRGVNSILNKKYFYNN